MAYLSRLQAMVMGVRGRGVIDGTETVERLYELLRPRWRGRRLQRSSSKSTGEAKPAAPLSRPSGWHQRGVSIKREELHCSPDVPLRVSLVQNVGAVPVIHQHDVQLHGRGLPHQVLGARTAAPVIVVEDQDEFDVLVGLQ